MSTPDTLNRRVADALARRGNQRVTLRHLTTSGPPHLLPNPPTLVSPVLDGDTASGTSTIAIRAEDARGRMLDGDKLRIGDIIYRITATANSRALTATEPGFDAVAITPGLVASLTDGAEITPIWSADTTVTALVQSYPLRLVDGTRIQSRDLMVTIAAYGLEQPSLTDQIIIGADIRSIMGVTPTYAGDRVVRWEIQAR
jgi:hypothetical protein